MRRIVVIALALLALSPGVVRASALYRCASDDEVRTACCCPAAARHHDAGGARPALRPACCCTISQIAAREAGPRATPAPVATPPAHAIAALITVAAPVPVARSIGSRAAPLPPRGPPGSLFALRCALLL